MPSPLLVPSSPLTIRNSAPPPDKPTSTPPDRFILFGESWLTMQNAVAASLKLPLNQGDFTSKYGSFPDTDKAEVDGCFAAMANLRDLSSSFGDPMAIKAKIASDGNYLLTATPPTEIYGHIVWLAMQIENAASTFDNTFAVLQELLSPSGGTPAERADNLRNILTGDGGLTSTAADMRDRTGTLSSKLATFDGKVNEAATAIMEYSGGSSKILADANQLLGQLQSDIKTMRKAAEEAHTAWRNYTIAAVTTSVGITILSGGMLWFVGLGLGIGLGVAAAKEMALYNKLVSQIAGKEADVTRKTQLVTDLGGLNTQMPGLVAAVSDFKTRMEEVEGVWTDIGGNLAYIASNYTDEQLSNYSWVIQTTKILDAQKKWQAICDTAQQFTQHSLVSYDTSLSFGQPIPTT